MAQNSSLKNKSVSGIVWGAIERFFSKGLSFIFNLIIARLLFPDQYGIVTIVTTICGLCQILVESGFNSALIRKQNRTETDINTVFYFNLFVSLFFYLILFFLAPLIASLFNEPILKDITRVVSTLLIFNAIGFTQSVHLSIELRFKTGSIINLCCSLISGVLAIFMALKGFGVWALALQTLSAVVIRNILYIICVRWKPKWIFSIKSLKDLFNYSSKLLLATGVGSVYSAIVNMAIGKKISMNDLGLYGRADSLVATPSNIIFDPIKTTTFPVFSKIQNDKERLLNYYKQTLKITAFLAFPVLLGIFAIADPLVRVLLTDKWAGAIPLLRIACFIYLLQPIVPVCQNYLLALGHSGSFLKVQLISKGIGLILIISSLKFGIIGVSLAQVATWSLFAILYANKVTPYSGHGVLKIGHDILPSFILSLLMCGVVTLSMIPFQNNILKLVVGVLTGMFFYTTVAYLLRLDELNTVIDLAKSYLHKNSSNETNR